MSNPIILKEGAEGHKGTVGPTAIDQIIEAAEAQGFSHHELRRLRFSLSTLCMNDMPAGLELHVEVKRG